MTNGYLVGSKTKPKKSKCNKKNKNLDCKENRGTGGGGEPVYRADTMKGLGTLNV